MEHGSPGHRFGEQGNMAKVALRLMRSMVVVALLDGAAQAATPQSRSFVSGTGVDTNPCTQLLPCRTFAAALSLTVVGGEIYVLNSAEYGPATINKAVTITSEGAVAGVRATSGAAITISAGASDAINLRGIDMDGTNSASTGIQFTTGGSLSIQKSLIRNFAQAGINFAPTSKSTLFVFDTTLAQNVMNGVAISNSATATLGRIAAFANGVGILATGANVSVTLSDVVASNNSYGVGASAAAVMVRNAMLTNNLIGISADAGAVVRVGTRRSLATERGGKPRTEAKSRATAPTMSAATQPMALRPRRSRCNNNRRVVKRTAPHGLQFALLVPH